MIIPIFSVKAGGGQGYIAGTSDGIVTVAGQPAARQIAVFDAESLALQTVTMSLPSGHYIITGLNPNKRYLIMGRDYTKVYEPAVFDYVTPATDLTIQQQQALWNSWQTN